MKRRVKKLTKTQIALGLILAWAMIAIYRTVRQNRALSRSQAPGPFLQSFAHNFIPLIPDVQPMASIVVPASLEF